MAKKLKVLLLGNTCNNNFSFLRYLKDLGIEAQLALYSDEGLPNSNPIHNPEWDTFHYSKYTSSVIRLDIPHSLYSIVGDPRCLKTPPSLAKLSQLVKKK